MVAGDLKVVPATANIDIVFGKFHMLLIFLLCLQYTAVFSALLSIA